MQEDKEAVFDAAENLELAILAMTGMVADMSVDTGKMSAAAGSGFSIATDLADWLVREAGLPFREAHHVTGRVVALAEEKGCRLDELTLEEFKSIDDRITGPAMSVLTVEKSVASRTSFGGTAPRNVLAQVSHWRDRVNAERDAMENDGV